MPRSIVTVGDVREFLASDTTREVIIDALRGDQRYGGNDVVLTAAGVQLALLDILDRVVE